MLKKVYEKGKQTQIQKSYRIVKCAEVVLTNSDVTESIVLIDHIQNRKKELNKCLTTKSDLKSRGVDGGEQ